MTGRPAGPASPYRWAPFIESGFVSGPPTDASSWSGLEEFTAERGWECPYCSGGLALDLRPVEVGVPGLGERARGLVRGLRRAVVPA